MQGVGAKVGLSILSALSVNEIQMAVMAGDSKAFTRVSGIGPKLAARLANELKGKLGSLGTHEEMPIIGASASNEGRVAADALSALANLGYGRTEAGMVIARILKESPDISTNDLIRLSLKEIGKGF